MVDTILNALEIVNTSNSNQKVVASTIWVDEKDFDIHYNVVIVWALLKLMVTALTIFKIRQKCGEYQFCQYLKTIDGVFLFHCKRNASEMGWARHIYIYLKYLTTLNFFKKISL